MSAQLHLTPTRLALLRDIADPDVKVYRQRSLRKMRRDESLASIRHGSDGRRVMTSACDELERAGWIRLGHAEHPSMYAPRPWELTDLGRQVLAAAEKEKRA